MTPCESCGAIMRQGRACPHCGGVRTGRVSSAVVALMGLALVGCPAVDDEDAVALYGAEVIDFDGDGAPADIDCDDEDPTIYPGADELEDDGIDSNCDGFDDT